MNMFEVHVDGCEEKKIGGSFLLLDECRSRVGISFPFASFANCARMLRANVKASSHLFFVISHHRDSVVCGMYKK